MKNLNPVFLFALSLVTAACTCCNAGQSAKNSNRFITGNDTTAMAGNYSMALAFPNLKFDDPVELTSPADNTDRVFVVEQKGKIRVLKNKADEKDAPVFLDIVSKVQSGGERGLLGLAFHPDYKNNGYFYVNYTRGPSLETVIARYKVSVTNPDMADPASETILLRYSQPFANHNGGKVAFGNDGFLYIAAGDGGAGGDPGNRAQNKKELLGKIMRIDINKPYGNLPYTIPADNPFAGNKEGFREEIYAYGVRNPWRFSFDRPTGTLWAGDVGQDKIEEVDIIEKGGNYGWRIMEAEACYKSDNCDKTGLIEPVISYPHGGATGNSITGGYVCHDKNLPGLGGKYIYGDYTSGNVWSLTYEGKKAVKNELIGKIISGLSSFGEDSKGNLYLLAYGNGQVYKMIEGK
jgi:glucose/arabinose dehydrogenase